MAGRSTNNGACQTNGDSFIQDQRVGTIQLLFQSDPFHLCKRKGLSLISVGDFSAWHNWFCYTLPNFCYYHKSPSYTLLYCQNFWRVYMCLIHLILACPKSLNVFNLSWGKVVDATKISYRMLLCLQRLNLTDYERALEFRELLDFQNGPIIHGRYEADQKCCSFTQRFRTRQLRNLPLYINRCPDCIWSRHLVHGCSHVMTYSRVATDTYIPLWCVVSK